MSSLCFLLLKQALLLKLSGQCLSSIHLSAIQRFLRTSLFSVVTTLILTKDRGIRDPILMTFRPLLKPLQGLYLLVVLSKDTPISHLCFICTWMDSSLPSWLGTLIILLLQTEEEVLLYCFPFTLSEICLEKTHKAFDHRKKLL